MSDRSSVWDHADCPFCHGTKSVYNEYVYVPSPCRHTQHEAAEELARDLADPPAAKWERYCIQHNLKDCDNEPQPKFTDDESNE